MVGAGESGIVLRSRESGMVGGFWVGWGEELEGGVDGWGWGKLDCPTIPGKWD